MNIDSRAVEAAETAANGPIFVDNPTRPTSIGCDGRLGEEPTAGGTGATESVIWGREMGGRSSGLGCGLGVHRLKISQGNHENRKEDWGCFRPGSNVICVWTTNRLHPHRLGLFLKTGQKWTEVASARPASGRDVAGQMSSLYPGSQCMRRSSLES